MPFMGVDVRDILRCARRMGGRRVRRGSNVGECS
jgi:hypothetical protein